MKQYVAKLRIHIPHVCCCDCDQLVNTLSSTAGNELEGLC